MTSSLRMTISLRDEAAEIEALECQPGDILEYRPLGIHPREELS
jgi:DNA-binding Xre family transcriptional regulator